MENSMRRAITQARFNDNNGNILCFEILLISIVFGVANESWWIFGGIFLGFIIAINIKPLANILIFIFSIGWGLMGFSLGKAFFGSLGAETVLTILSFLISYGIHSSGVQSMNDNNS